MGVIRGGFRPNVVPDLAEAEVDVRFPTLAKGRVLEAALRALRPVDATVTLEVEGGLHYPPLERSTGVIALYERAREVASEMGLTLDEAATGGASEASFAGALGIPPRRSEATETGAPRRREHGCFLAAGTGRAGAGLIDGGASGVTPSIEGKTRDER